MLKQLTKKQLEELSHVLCQISDADYVQPMVILNGNTIGKHVRHILEFYSCLFSDGNGVVSYDDRKRSQVFEDSVRAASEYIIEVLDKVEGIESNRKIVLKASYNGKDSFLESSLLREVAFNVEHTIHHLAIIGIAVSNSLNYIKLPAQFGYANSTVQYLKSVKQFAQ